MIDAPRTPKLPRWAKALILAAVFALVYTVTGFWIVPAIVKSQVLKRLPPMTQRQASVEEVTFNPFTFEFALRGLKLTESNGSTFAGLDALHVQFQALDSISHGAWAFHDVTITHPYAHVIRLQDGSFNFDNLVPTTVTATSTSKPAAPAASTSLPAVLVESLRVDGASVDADDLAVNPPFHDKLAPINVQLTDFTTKSNTASSCTVSLATDAEEKFSLTGKVMVQPLQSSGSVKVTGVDLKRYAAYVAPFTTAEVADGKVDAGLDYQFALGPKGPDAKATNGVVQLSNLVVKAPGLGETVVAIPALTVSLSDASLAEKAAHISSVKSSGGSMVLRQEPDGKINLLALIKPPATMGTTPFTTAVAASSSPAWRARVDEVAFDGYGMAVEDRKATQPFKMNVSALAFTVKGFDTAGNAPLSTDMSMRLNGQGSLSVNGTVGLAPVSADLNLDLAGLELPAFAAYLPGNIKVVLSKGDLSVKGRAQGAVASGIVSGAFEGDASLKNLSTADLAHDRDLVKFNALDVKGIKASYAPLKLHIAELDLSGFNVNAVINPNGQINLLSVVSTSETPQSAAASNAPIATVNLATPAFDLGTLRIEKASLHYIDESIEPNAIFDLQELSGTIQGLSTRPQGPARVDFKGNVDQFSPYSITGTIDPLSKDLSLDLAISMKNIDLTSFTPYMERYGGYPLNKGKLMLDLKYSISNGKLDSSNKVKVSDLTLGARNNSTNAVHLPIKLGVALLKDRHGVIDLDVPVSGRLDDPNFKIGPIIWHVIENLLAKAATSPFTFLGKIVGGSSEELSSVDFAPGESTLAPSEQAKIKKLAKALYERPNLSLQIAGACAPAADGAVIAQKHLRRQIKKMHADELSADGVIAPSVETMQLDHADYARLLQKLFEKTFGTNLVATVTSNVPASTPAKPAPAGQAAPAKVPELLYVPTVAEVTRSRATGVKGGERLMEHQNSQPSTGAAVAVAPASASTEQPSTPSPTQPAVPSGPDLAEMERRLIAGIHVTDSELRELMQDRARAVQTALLETGQVPAERVFLLAPKPIDAAAKGETRANFSLQ